MERENIQLTQIYKAKYMKNNYEKWEREQIYNIQNKIPEGLKREGEGEGGEEEEEREEGSEQN